MIAGAQAAGRHGRTLGDRAVTVGATRFVTNIERAKPSPPACSEQGSRHMLLGGWVYIYGLHWTEPLLLQRKASAVELLHTPFARLRVSVYMQSQPLEPWYT